jgi:hypothetical protein
MVDVLNVEFIILPRYFSKSRHYSAHVGPDAFPVYLATEPIFLGAAFCSTPYQVISEYIS